MATTKFLNSDRTVWATTYWGGRDKGRCIDISMKVDDNTQLTAAFDEGMLKAMLRAYGDERGLAVPSADDESAVYQKRAVERRHIGPVPPVKWAWTEPVEAGTVMHKMFEAPLEVGEDDGNAAKTEDNAQFFRERDYKIREMFTKGQCTRKELGQIYGLTYQQVYAITGPNPKNQKSKKDVHKKK